MPHPHLPIGVFDSGVGGLTVLHALQQRLPDEPLLYLGDTARVPYGSRSPETVVRYSSRVAGHLWRAGIKALVVACNTASTWALEALRAEGEKRGIPVIGVIQPGVHQAIVTTQSKHVGIIGTEGTIRGGRYQTLLAEHGVRVTAQPCPLFVALAEEGWHDDEVAIRVAERYLEPLQQGPDTVILGCTHYPLLAPAIQQVLPGVTLVDSAHATAQAVAQQLKESNLLGQGGSSAALRFLVTDNPERFRQVGERFLQHDIESVEVVDLADPDEWLAPA